MSGRLREIRAPFIVAAPAGARVRTRLRVSPRDAAVLEAAGRHLGSLAAGDLAARCKEGRLDAEGRAVSRRGRKQALTARASSRWAGAIPARRKTRGSSGTGTCVPNGRRCGPGSG